MAGIEKKGSFFSVFCLIKATGHWKYLQDFVLWGWELGALWWFVVSIQYIYSGRIFRPEDSPLQ